MDIHTNLERKLGKKVNFLSFCIKIYYRHSIIFDIFNYLFLILYSKYFPIIVAGLIIFFLDSDKYSNLYQSHSRSYFFLVPYLFIF